MVDPDESASRKRKIVTRPVAGKIAPLIPVPEGTPRMLDVLFPAVVKNPSTALSLLSPELSVSSTEPGAEVSLRFRPGDGYSVPIRGTVQPAVKLVLKVNKRTKAVRVVGIVTKELVFTGLADFQLTYPPPPHNPNYIGVPSEIPDYDTVERDRFGLRIIPQFHSHRQFPFDYFFHSDAGPVKPTLKGKQASKSIVVHWRCELGNAIPERPLETYINQARESYVKEHSARIEELFRIRPIWSTAAFSCTIGIKELPARQVLLPYFAYYCGNGPWRGMWIKFGFDPRSDPMTRCYQLVDYRAPRSTEIRPPIPLHSSVKEHKTSMARGGKGLNDTYHIYKADVVPLKRQCHFQVCDIKDSRCQAMLRNYETSVFTTEDGFYSRGYADAARKIMQEQLALLFKKNTHVADEEMD